MKKLTSFYRIRFCEVIIIILLFFILFNVNIIAQQGPPFPRTGVYHFGKSQPEWYAKLGLVIFLNNSSAFADKIHAINPDCKILYGRDWNVADWLVLSHNLPNEWKVRDSNGKGVYIYGGSWPLIDITDYCPRAQTKYGYLRYNEYLPRYLTDNNVVDMNSFDGVASNGSWYYPYGVDNVDLDRNSVADEDEHGLSWVKSVWTNDLEKTLSDLRNRIGDDKIVHINSSTLHLFGWKTTNGMTFENIDVTYNVKYTLNRYLDWKDTAPYPHTMLVDAKGKTKDRFYQMRYFLGVALVYDAYCSYSGYASGEHRYDKYYDEFDVNLGYPKDRARQVKIGEGGYEENTEQGIWVKFYDNGMVIVNFDHRENTVTDAEIQAKGFQYYDGPYYKFQGGQRSNYNNGELFTEVSLIGVQRAWDPLGFVGDAIILLKAPDTVVADIIIDNIDAGTSPASIAATFKGTWTNSDENNEAFWGVGGRAYCNLFNYAKTQPGRGESYAVYTPTIGLSGNYEVFEWHGWLGSSPEDIVEATDVPVELKFAENQVVEGYIDQSQNAQQWNSLGTYYFAGGTYGSVKITNEADGQVIADAFKFVYKGDDSDDTVSPNPPTDLQMSGHTEHTINLEWYEPGPASDGDSAAAYQVFRNGNLVGRPFKSRFTDEGLTENTEYTYDVYSVDNRGNRSSSSIQKTFVTTTDQIPPEILEARLITGERLQVFFSEKLNFQSAVDPSHYFIRPDITVSMVTVNEKDSTIYYLTTTKHIVGERYYLSAQDIIDQASIPNSINPNDEYEYVGITGDSLKITISADDAYELYVNGYFIAKGEGWDKAEIYEVPTIGGTNIIAVKGIDNGGEAGIVAQIEFNNNLFFTNENWKITTSEEVNWEQLGFNDVLWDQATSLGLHGSAKPWAQYSNVAGISTTDPVHWIWSSDNIVDDTVFLRYKLGYEDDTEAPTAPSGVVVDIPQ